MDRAVIQRHLLSVPTDPFNRQRLDAADLRPNDELRARIRAWRAEQRALRAAAKSSVIAADNA